MWAWAVRNSDALKRFMLLEKNVGTYHIMQHKSINTAQATKDSTINPQDEQKARFGSGSQNLIHGMETFPAESLSESRAPSRPLLCR